MSFNVGRWMIFMVVTGEWSTSCLIVYVRGCTNILVLVTIPVGGKKRSTL